MREQVQAGEPRLPPSHRGGGDRRRNEVSSPVDAASELSALVELTTTLASDVPVDQALAAALAILMRPLQVQRGAFFVRRADGTLALGPSRALPPGAPATLSHLPSRGDVAALAPGARPTIGRASCS